ncbi:THAP domain-containing protein [Ooceraea biroi]|uniref:THAP domain-containing protein n=1 Tax=Ooceraea biroi TaxID=2015173 RepID=A0A026W6W6_OOCBI|nr:THAP domain-containing protein [Ooceraea biroi]
MMDEMAIRKQLKWNHSEKKFVGYVDCGTVIREPDAMPLAKEALVYLLTGINERWKIPVAYFYVNSVTSQERAEITLQVLNFIVPSGVNVIALTFDGLSANIKMCTEFNADVYNSRRYFRHPSQDHDVVIFLDAAHMLKLIRTAWAIKRVLYDGNGNPIKWEFIENLVRLQENGYFHLANKINNKHLQWQTNKMSVKLAAQTLSQSCATALKLLMEEGHPYFLECATTVKFLEIVNNAFDCLNSRSMFSHGFKRPLKPDTAFDMFKFCTEAIQYFSDLKIHPNAKPITESKSKTGFLGFIIDLKNLKKIYQDYVETGYLKYILSYKFSQDHLEIFFSVIRAMGGYNNNPNCVQFSSAYKCLLHYNEVKSSAAANCLPLDNTRLLTISSKPIKKHCDYLKEEEIENVMIDDILLHFDVNSTIHHAVLNISGFVERRVLQQLSCNTCIQLLNSCKEATSHFIDLKSRKFALSKRRYLYNNKHY